MIGKRLGFLKNGEAGFSLTELMVTLALLLVASSATYGFLMSSQRSYLNTQLRTRAQNNARLAMDRMKRDLRVIEDPSDALEAIELAKEDEIIFYANLNNAPGPERIRYYLRESGELMKELTNPGEQAPWTYDGQAASLEVAEFVRVAAGETLFRYFDGSGTELAVSGRGLTAAQLEDVRRIEIRVAVDVDTGSDPPAYVLSSEVIPRNLRD